MKTLLPRGSAKWGFLPRVYGKTFCLDRKANKQIPTFLSGTSQPARQPLGWRFSTNSREICINSPLITLWLCACGAEAAQPGLGAARGWETPLVMQPANQELPWHALQQKMPLLRTLLAHEQTHSLPTAQAGWKS